MKYPLLSININSETYDIEKDEDSYSITNRNSEFYCSSYNLKLLMMEFYDMLIGPEEEDPCSPDPIKFVLYFMSKGEEICILTHKENKLYMIPKRKIFKKTLKKFIRLQKNIFQK